MSIFSAHLLKSRVVLIYFVPNSNCSNIFILSSKLKMKSFLRISQLYRKLFQSCFYFQIKLDIACKSGFVVHSAFYNFSYKINTSNPIHIKQVKVLVIQCGDYLGITKSKAETVSNLSVATERRTSIQQCDDISTIYISFNYCAQSSFLRNG